MSKGVKWLVVLALAGTIYGLLGGAILPGSKLLDSNERLNHEQVLLQAAQSGQPVFLEFYGDY